MQAYAYCNTLLFAAQTLVLFATQWSIPQPWGFVVLHLLCYKCPSSSLLERFFSSDGDGDAVMGTVTVTVMRGPLTAMPGPVRG